MPVIPNDPTKPVNYGEWMGPTARLNCVPTLKRLEIHLTYKCVLKCPQCISLVWQAPTNKEMTVEQIQKLVDDSKKLNWQWERISLHGGESALHPQLKEICKILADYKAESNPNVRLILCSAKSNEEILKGVKIADSFGFETEHNIIKSLHTIGLEHLPYTYSPDDTNEDYTLGCNSASDCGMAYNSEGFFQCSNAAAASRVFNFPPVATELKDVTLEKLIDAFSIHCKHCGFSRPHSVYDPTKKMTPTWKKVLTEYRNKHEKINT